MEQPPDEEQFRDRILELALTQLAPLFVEFLGSNGRDMRFDTWETYQLRNQIAAALGAFIDRASVEALPEEYRNLMPTNPHDFKIRQVYIDAERQRLEEAGLSRRKGKT